MPLGDFGQPRLERLLDEMLARGRVAGSFLFDGPAGVGKEALAVELGRLLNCERGDAACGPRPEFRRSKAPAAAERCASCRKFDHLQHPDLTLVFPVPTQTWDKEPGEVVKILARKAADPYYRHEEFERPTGIQAEVLRDVVMPAVYSRPVEGRVRTVVVADADQMAPNVGNLLLKTLEEPPPSCLLVLTTSVPERLLPTILSRCQRLRFAPLATEWMEPRLQLLHEATPTKARVAASMAQGSMLAAARFLRGDLDGVRERAFAVLAAASSGEWMVLLEEAQALAHDAPKKRWLLPLFLQLLGLAARDAMLLAEGVVEPARRAPSDAAPALVNADRAADLLQVARRMPPAALQQLVRRAESAERQLAGHAHAEQTLAVLFTEMAAAADSRPAAARR